MFQTLLTMKLETECANISDDGIPCQPRGIIFRHDLLEKKLSDK